MATFENTQRKETSEEKEVHQPAPPSWTQTLTTAFASVYRVITHDPVSQLLDKKLEREILEVWHRVIRDDCNDRPRAYTITERSRHADILLGIVDMHYPFLMENPSIARDMRIRLLEAAGFVMRY